ncbi:MAG: molybdate ABC transporter permease subunit [Syntrophomonadaceae bacterium]|nr:molybdate ABC transporter permease subunit [Syntrophomonadaceae bacterium]
MDLFPLYNSLRISAIATLAALIIGILTAYLVLRLPSVLKGICDTVLTIPLVLPPTVVGYFILIWLSPKSALGSKFWEWFSLTITMRWYASVIAVTIIAFPFIYRTVRGSFEAFDQNLLDAGRTLGLSETYIFGRILLPNCRQGILAGTVLAFARGLGEYGATSMVSGYIAGKTATVSTSVAYFWQINQEQAAEYWVTVNLVVSFVFMILINVFNKPKARE